jgi:hypothetical protein
VLALGSKQALLLAHDVIPRHRHHFLALGELDLEYHPVLLAERHFRCRKIELPHPHEAPIIDALDLLASVISAADRTKLILLDSRTTPLKPTR